MGVSNSRVTPEFSDSNFNIGPSHNADEQTHHNSTTKSNNNAAASISQANLNESDKQTLIASTMIPIQCLHYAAEVGNNALIRKAYDAGADINTPDIGLQAPSNTDEQEKTNSSEQLEKEPAIYKDVIITGDFPIHKAINNNHLSTVELLFFLQADLECRNRVGSTPLHRAVSLNHIEIVKFLISKGARVDSVNSIGNTSLHIATYCGHFEIAKLLLELRQDQSHKLLNYENNSGMTALDYAKKRVMIDLLNQYKQITPQASNRLTKQISFSLNAKTDSEDTHYDKATEEIKTIVSQF